MPIFNTLIVVVILASLGLCLISLSLIVAYNKKYHLPESKYTKLFGVITKEQITIAYLVTVLFHGAFTIWLILTI